MRTPGSAVDRLVAALREQLGVLGSKPNTTQPLVAKIAVVLDAVPRPERSVLSERAADGTPAPVHAAGAAPAVVGAGLLSGRALR